MAEHRSMQRAALLDAARGLLAEGGMDALTFPALAARTGLARSSVYEYFRSRGAVVEELCRIDFPVWAREIEDAMAAAGDDPAAQVEAYVRRQLDAVRDARHRAVVAISAGELDAGARDQIRAAHGRLVEMIVDAVAALGVQRPALVAALLQGVIRAATRQLAVPQAEADAVVDEAVAMSLRAVGV
ncbi:TetR family transcriptional regulator [Mangrovactinospora gilvigrisea]|uniref:TetR family transcriptional regulator n=1 Tax=Mangrovactinospora gilvigrisea TaxID=1428644 RepID=A0A1J7CAL0_9ACTN|nr:TetR/AcrR family transcriptional regulator [Mangrovactinospora gilvigrisea]OIV38552.1 TetR family transcriptional regulator [Mangrovactinospora gilvigrisea]